MAQDSISASTPYCTAARVFAFRDERAVLELLTDAAADVTREQAGDPDTGPGATLLAALMAASGEVEEHVLRGERYSVADLQALAGNSKVRLEGLTADVAFWNLAKRRWPRSKREDVTGAADAERTLRRLADGELILGLAGAAQAADKATIAPLYDAGAGAGRTVTKAARYFGGGRGRGRE